jgi:hypothetical protein
MIAPSVICYHEKKRGQDTLVAELGGHNPPHRIKKAKTLEGEQHYVIQFVADEGTPGVEIVSRLRNHSGEHALSRTQVYWSINKVKRWKTDLNTIAGPARDRDDGLAGVIAGKLDADSHLSARKLAHSLGIAASTVSRYLTEVLGMPCRHLRWVPHTLSSAHTATPAE